MNGKTIGGILWLLIVTSGFGSSRTAIGNESRVDIPELAWEVRSDWINVKTASQPGAKGDGIADDTAAIQTALNQIQEGATIYFPPGTYRITRTLETPEGRYLGVSLVGHGRATQIVWDGETNGRMFWPKDGMPYSRYVGLSWDGKGKAGVGFDHSSQKVFETEIRHQHEAFRNFTDAGVRVGHEYKTASAETMYENCLFEKCKFGAYLISFNVYNQTFEGCDFRDCVIGVYSGKGSNGYVRNCHFESSEEADVQFVGEHCTSVRRCTSQGSRQFVKYGSGVGPLIVQDCQVEGWTHPEGAIKLHGASVLIFDCGFRRGPAGSPAIYISHTAQRLIVSNNQTSDGEKLLNTVEGSRVIEIPGGQLTGSLRTASRRFLKSGTITYGKVFDAKRDFGARGDFQTDDTVAIQKTIAAAQTQGNGAIAYLPTGRYLTTSTLELSGRNYVLAGSGLRTAIVWRGPEGGTTLEVRNPQEVTVANICIGFHEPETGKGAIDILQVGTGTPSSIAYDSVWVWGMYQRNALEHGLHLRNLGENDRVNFRQFNGNLRIADSAMATVFLGLTYEGSIVVEGKSPARKGFIGGCVRLATQSDPAAWIKDNQSLVLSDYYAEQSIHLLRLSGDAALPPGRVTLQGAKFALMIPENNAVEVDNYHGELALGPYQFYADNPVHHFVQRGTASFALSLVGPTFYNSKPEFKLAPTSQLNVTGLYSVGLNSDDTVSPTTGLNDTPQDEAIPGAVRALDDLRRLGAVDLEMNHPE